MLAHYGSTGRPLVPGDTYVVLATSKMPGLVLDRDPGVEGHWLIRPADPSEMDTWIVQRPSHRLTDVLSAAIIEPRRRKV